MNGTPFVENYYNITTVHPLALIALLIAGVATMTVPRRYALVPMLVLACCIAPAQRVVFATLDFSFLRMMIVMGWMRVIAHREWNGFTWKPLDVALLIWGLCATMVPIAALGTTESAINRFGYLYDAVGSYFLVRCVVRSWDDVLGLSRCVAVLAVPIMGAFVLEKATGRNVFALFGGVPETTVIRDGRLRCRGPFSHPILAGAFWASLLPLVLSLWRHGGWNRPLTIVGATAAAVIIWSTSSATSLNGLTIALLAAAAYPARRWLSWMRLATVVGLVFLHFAMVSPVWGLLTKMNSVSGSTGWYRYKLIDDFIRHFFDWWLLGTRDFSTWWLEGRFAITSEYVMQGVRGGVFTLGAFLALITLAFLGVGHMLRDAARPRLGLQKPHAGTETGIRTALPTRWTPRSRSFAAWALGASLLTHCAVFIGVAYFAQAVLMWYFTLGLIGSLTPQRRRKPRASTRLHALARPSHVHGARPRVGLS